MKTPILAALLTLSLIGNVYCFFHQNTSTAFSVASPSTDWKTETLAKPAAGATTATPKEIARIAEVWSGLQTSDLTVLVARLRAAGFSPAMIRAIVAARVQEQFSARRKALLAQQEERPFWKTGPNFFLDAKTMSGLRELGREQSDLMKQLLGTDGVLGSDERLAYQRRQFGDLPREKVDQMQNIVEDYSELRSQVYAAANGVMLPEDREKLTLLEKEQHSDLAALLTPEELENYELRSSPTATALRSQLALFNPSEDEFRAIFKLQQAFDEKYGSARTITSGEQYRQRQTQQQELLAQVKNVLSPDRLEVYQQATDPSSQMINRLVARLELPVSVAKEVTVVQRDITTRASALRTDKSLTSDVRNLQLNALAQEANAKLTAALGARGLEAYKQYGGQWVQNLVSRSSTPQSRNGR